MRTFLLYIALIIYTIVSCTIVFLVECLPLTNANHEPKIETKVEIFNELHKEDINQKILGNQINGWIMWRRELEEKRLKNHKGEFK